MNPYTIRPIQKFEYTLNKSSTDTALIIDAMDLLYSKKVDGFCIISSDSDYTGLAHRIREEGLLVVGIGRMMMIVIRIMLVMILMENDNDIIVDRELIFVYIFAYLGILSSEVSSLMFLTSIYLYVYRHAYIYV